jgi:hypothetical protein
MGIDLNKMREKLTKLQNKGGNKSLFWRPSDGEQTVRIVPTSDGDPFKEYWFHYNLGQNAGFLSPKRNYGENDPLNDFIQSLYSENTEESIKMAKSLSARQRFFAPVIVRGEEDKGVRVWGFGKQVYEQLLNLVLNPEYGDITDVKEGTDINLKYGKPAGASFPVTTLTPSRKASTVCPDLSDAECVALLEQVPDFDGLFERKTPEQVGTLLNAYLAGGDDGDAEEASKETTKYSGSSGTSSSSVEGAFKELLG